MPDPTLRLRYYQETGQTELAKKYEQYLRETGQMPAGDDTVEVQASYPERLATTILEGAQVIPGMKSLEALAGSIGSKFTDTPVSYTDAKAGLEEQTGRMGRGRQLLSQAVSSPVLAPIMAVRGVSALSPVMQGAGYGAANEALDINPDETNESRVLRTALGAGAGAALAGTAAGVAKFVKSPPGTTGAVAAELFPKTARAIKAYKTATKAPELVKPQVRLGEASAPKAEGLLSNGPENFADVIRAQSQRPSLNDLYNAEAQAADAAQEGLIAGAVKGKPWQPRHAPKARFDWFAEQFANRKLP